jgi:hypothetical protein
LRCESSSIVDSATRVPVRNLPGSAMNCRRRRGGCRSSPACSEKGRSCVSKARSGRQVDQQRIGFVVYDRFCEPLTFRRFWCANRSTASGTGSSSKVAMTLRIIGHVWINIDDLFVPIGAAIREKADECLNDKAQN